MSALRAAVVDLLERFGVAPEAQLVVAMERMCRAVLAAAPRVVESLERRSWQLLEVVFVPRLVLNQLLALGALRGALVFCRGLTYISARFLSRLTTKGRVVDEIRTRMERADTYQAWRACAEELDSVTGGDRWRRDKSSPYFDGAALQHKIDALEALLQRGDIFTLMFQLRGSMARHQFGLLHEGHFNVAVSGTKCQIDKYLRTVVRSLDAICDANVDSIPTDVKLAFFNETRHAYGRTALLLSGGAIMGFYHSGVLLALVKASLLPRVISGSSAGAIITATVGTHTNEELYEMIRTADGLRTDFIAKRKIKGSWRDLWGWLNPNVSLWQKLLGTVSLDTDHLRRTIQHNTGHATFQEAFDYTGKIINVTVSPNNRTDPPRLLNYLTAPHVLVWSAALASSCIPGVFEAQPLMVKDADGTVRPESDMCYSDGSVEADLPMLQLTELFNVNHFIVSQVNPHAALLSTLSLGEAEVGISGLYHSMAQQPILDALAGLVTFLQAQLRSWFKNLTRFLSTGSGSPEWAWNRGMLTMLMQEYQGRPGQDISIMPWAGDVSPFGTLFKFLSNFKTKEQFFHVRDVGERNTWPKMPQIHAHCVVEVQLERCVSRLRQRLAQEAVTRELTNLRRNRLGNGGDASSVGAKKMAKAAYSFAQFPSQPVVVEAAPPPPAPPQTTGAAPPAAGADSFSGGYGQPEEEDEEEEAVYTTPPLVTTSGLAVTDGFHRKRLSLERLEKAWDDAQSRRVQTAADADQAGGADGAEMLALPRGPKSWDGMVPAGGKEIADDGIDRSASPPDDGEEGTMASRLRRSSVVKSTSMASFYYRKARSSNDLQKLK